MRNTQQIVVSTHSRPKAAGLFAEYFAPADMFQLTAARRRLAKLLTQLHLEVSRFNSQPPEGGWKSASCFKFKMYCFNSQPPEGGWKLVARVQNSRRGFNSQPPEGGWRFSDHIDNPLICFNSQPPEGGWDWCHSNQICHNTFQLTAARRRLAVLCYMDF